AGGGARGSVACRRPRAVSGHLLARGLQVPGHLPERIVLFTANTLAFESPPAAARCVLVGSRSAAASGAGPLGIRPRHGRAAPESSSCLLRPCDPSAAGASRCDRTH